MRVRTFLVVVCLLTGVSAAEAQQTSTVQAGLIGGLNWFQLSASDDTGNVNFDASSGWAAGLFITTPSRGHVSLQPELQFAVRRTELPVLAGVLVRQRLTSIDVPFFLRISTTPHGSVAAHLLAGPALTIRTGAKQTTIVGSASTTEDVSDLSRRFDIAIAVGGGVDVGRLLFDLRYQHGLRNVLVDQSGGASARLRTVTAVAGVRF